MVSQGRACQPQAPPVVLCRTNLLNCREKVLVDRIACCKCTACPLGGYDVSQRIVIVRANSVLEFSYLFTRSHHEIRIFPNHIVLTKKIATINKIQFDWLKNRHRYLEHGLLLRSPCLEPLRFWNFLTFSYLLVTRSDNEIRITLLHIIHQSPFFAEYLIATSHWLKFRNQNYSNKELVKFAPFSNFDRFLC